MKPVSLIIHPSCPKKLVSALRRQKWNQSALARALGVNKGTINKLLHRGIEPRSIELRLKVFLPKHPRRPLSTVQRPPSPPLPPHRQWWNKQPPPFKDAKIRLLWLESSS